MIFAKYCQKVIRREILIAMWRISLSRAHVNLLLNLTSVINVCSMSSKY
jgi:hypothetical protein